jgi:hypothetical protein
VRFVCVDYRSVQLSVFVIEYSYIVFVTLKTQQHLWCSGNISAFQALALDSISGRCKSLFTFYYSFTMKDLFDTLQVFDGTCLMSHGYLVIIILRRS